MGDLPQEVPRDADVDEEVHVEKERVEGHEGLFARAGADEAVMCEVCMSKVGISRGIG